MAKVTCIEIEYLVMQRQLSWVGHVISTGSHDVFCTIVNCPSDFRRRSVSRKMQQYVPFRNNARVR